VSIWLRPPQFEKISRRGDLFRNCGPERIRTADLLIANEALYQLSYGPVNEKTLTRKNKTPKKENAAQKYRGGISFYTAGVYVFGGGNRGVLYIDK
jgi:hypothetical protein